LNPPSNGVTVNAVCPGYVWTPLVEKQIGDQAKARGISTDAVVRDVLLAKQATKQFAAIAEIDQQVEADIAPFRTAVKQLSSTPGVKALAAQVIVSEIGIDMSRFPSDGHLISWAGICPRNDESAGKRRSNRSMGHAS
jgi:transposase